MLKENPLDWSRDYTFWYRALQFVPYSYCHTRIFDSPA
jgi:hypothetical protein